MSPRRQQRSHARKRRSLRHPEGLEPRIVLTASGVVWPTAPFLSVSFAPDGTEVGDRPSHLSATMNHLGPREVWQGEILRAFQTWAMNTNADIGLVDDGGDDFGTAGPTTGDSRFGDVRIGAIVMDPNVYAITVSRGFTSGTWNGDVLFNRRAPVDTLDDLFKVALHEAGHLFGLEDNTDPTSAMFSTDIPSVMAPSANDLALVHDIYGAVRDADLNELGSESNGTQNDATRIRVSEDSNGFNGLAPSIIYGDISSGDVDVYRFDHDTYTGPVTFTVRSEGISLLQPRMSITDENGQLNLPDPVFSTSTTGDSISFTLPSASIENKYYVTVEANVNDENGVGGYSLVTTFDDLVETDQSLIDELAGGGEFRFLDQDRFQDIFNGDPQATNGLFAGEIIPNDTLATATVLLPLEIFVEGSRYRTADSISSPTDLDYYSIDSPDFTGGVPQTLTVVVDGILNTDSAWDVEIYDQAGVIVPHQTVLNHGGEFIVQVDGLQSQTNYFVRVGSVDMQQANYQMVATFGAALEALDMIGQGSATDTPISIPYVADLPQLLFPAVLGYATNDPQAILHVELQTNGGAVVTTWQGRADRFHSTASVLIAPGYYAFNVWQTPPLPGVFPPVDFDLLISALTDPLAIPLRGGIEPKVIQFDDSDVPGEFVFPEPTNPPNNPPATAPGAPATADFMGRNVGVAIDHAADEPDNGDQAHALRDRFERVDEFFAAFKSHQRPTDWPRQ